MAGSPVTRAVVLVGLFWVATICYLGPTIAVSAHGRPIATADFRDLFIRVSPAVVHISALTCDGDETGSGFLAGPDVVVTAGHVVDDAAALTVLIAGRRHSASVIGVDADLDLALLKVERPAREPLELADVDPGAASAVAALGFPRGGRLHMTEGVVVDPDATVTVDGRRFAGLVSTTATIEPGNSGGPLIDADGAVVGVVIIEGATGSFAIPVSEVARRVDDPGSLAEHVAPVCGNPLRPERGTASALDGLRDLDLELWTTFTGFFGSVNAGDHESAYGWLSPGFQARKPYALFAEGHATSFGFDFSVERTGRTSSGPVVGIDFTSVQASEHGPDGETCTHWSMEYQLVPAANRLLIDEAVRLDRRPCARTVR